MKHKSNTTLIPRLTHTFRFKVCVGVLASNIDDNSSSSICSFQFSLCDKQLLIRPVWKNCHSAIFLTIFSHLLKTVSNWPCEQLYSIARTASCYAFCMPRSSPVTFFYLSPALRIKRSLTDATIDPQEPIIKKNACVRPLDFPTLSHKFNFRADYNLELVI